MRHARLDAVPQRGFRQMHGLIRVRQFTISEGHLVLRPDLSLKRSSRAASTLPSTAPAPVGLLDKCMHVPLLPVGIPRTRTTSTRARRSRGSRPERDGAHPGKISTSTTLSAPRGRILRARSSTSSIRTCLRQGRHPSSPSRSTCVGTRRALRHVLHRRKRREEAAVHHPPHVSRLLRAHARLPHRGVCRRAADVDGARAGALPACHRPRRRLLRRAGQEAFQDMGFRVEASTTATRRPAARSATRRWRRVPSRWVVGDRDMRTAPPPAPPHGRRPRRDEHGRVPALLYRSWTRKKKNNIRILHNQHVRPSYDQRRFAALIFYT